MCEFHLKGQCFHPEKTTKGLVATDCTFHDCSDCTNKKWQKSLVEENYEYYKSIIELTQHQEQSQNDNEEDKKTLFTRIFSAKS